MFMDNILVAVEVTRILVCQLVMLLATSGGRKFIKQVVDQFIFRQVSQESPSNNLAGTSSRLKNAAIIRLKR